MKLYLFRHGETLQSKNQLPYGANELTAEILPEAIPQIHRIAEQLKKINPEVCFVSEFLRCRQTALIIEQVAGFKFTPTPLLNEYVGGEFNDLKMRGEEFLKVCADQKYQSVAVCTHGAVVACLKHLFETGEFELADLFDYPKTGVLLTLSSKI